MAKGNPILDKTFTSDVDLTAANVCVVASTSNAGQVKLPAAAAAKQFIGVTLEKSDTNKQVSVRVAGIVQVISDGSGTIAEGDYLTIADNTGKVKKVTVSFAGSGSAEIVGIALTRAAATSGLLVDMLIQPMLHNP